MKVLIPILIDLLVVGWGEKQSANTNESNNTKAKPSKELTPEEQKALRESVIGAYEIKYNKDNIHKRVLLENGIVEHHFDGKKLEEQKWVIVNGQIHMILFPEFLDVYRINSDKSITRIADVKEGKRTDYPKERQLIWEKIK